jgi:hypothetical protein
MALLFGDSSAIPMYTDSQCALRFIRNPELEDMRKRIDVILNHLRKRVDAGYIRFAWISGTESVCRCIYTSSAETSIWKAPRQPEGFIKRQSTPQI